MAVASKAGSAALLDSVRTSFVHGMDLSLVVSAGVAVVGLILAAVFLPASNAAKKTVQPDTGKDGEAAEKRPAITGQAA